MAVQPNAVANPMEEELVLLTKPGSCDYSSGRRIYILARYTDLCCRERCALRFFLNCPNVTLTLARLTEHEGTTDIRPVPVDATSTVHQDDVAFLQCLWLLAAVRECRRFAELCSASALDT